MLFAILAALLYPFETILPLLVRLYNYVGRAGFRGIEFFDAPITLYGGEYVLLMSDGLYDTVRWKDMEDLSEDVLAKHEEWNNLYTRGIWENVDAGELDDVFSEAKDVPRESLDDVEELLLSRQPEFLDNYTFAAIFVNKVFVEPNRKRRIRKIVIISVSVATVILILSFVLWMLYRKRQNQIKSMNRKWPGHDGVHRGRQLCPGRGGRIRRGKAGLFKRKRAHGNEFVHICVPLVDEEHGWKQVYKKVLIELNAQETGFGIRTLEKYETSDPESYPKREQNTKDFYLILTGKSLDAQ